MRGNALYKNGFTLLEVLVVLTILGFLTAMVVPAMGVMDDRARERETVKRMERIRRAMLGNPDRYDEKGRRIIGGYVGDMGRWPDLWEARAELRQSWAGQGWDHGAGPAAGLGQGPGYGLDPGKAFYRPSGHFVKGRWRWHTPYRKLKNQWEGAYANADHIGGLETENEGQPRGLWTRYVEDLNSDKISGHPQPGAVEGEAWKGPYINPPVDENLKDALHFAQSMDQYNALEPMNHATGTPPNHETWEDGSYATPELGELFDEKESFRLLQTDGRLADGWGRAFRFFITADKDRPGSTIFWMISEGPDHEGKYPNKGSCASHAWTEDTSDTMGNAYAPDDAYNQDNIVMKLFSYEWEAVLQEEKKEKEAETRRQLEAIRTAVLGEAPTGLNYGFTGDLCRLPKLFRWDGASSVWDDGAPPYTKGQPRELWIDTPNRDGSDNVPPSAHGIGWRHRYLKDPGGIGGENFIRDAWGRELLFFYDTGHDSMLVLSRGGDGKFDLGSTTADFTEPEDMTEAVDLAGYDPTATHNPDNLHIVIDKREWAPGYFRLAKLTVKNATVGTTRMRFFRGSADAASETVTAVSLVDADGDTVADDWVVGHGAAPALAFDDTTAEKVTTGARYLVIWNDTDGDNEPASGEKGVTFIYPLLGVPGSGDQGALSLDAIGFEDL